MKKKNYSQILDTVAGDQFPGDLDLTPTILARIQKGKILRMQPKTKLFFATLLVAIMFVALFYTLPGMAATIERWLGYLPGIGLVHEGQIRVLAEPVSVTREGITVTVEQAVLNQERTTLVYSVEGLPGATLTAGPEEILCGMEPRSYTVALRPLEGDLLLATPNGVESWSSGYRHRFNYQSIPADVNDAELVISCLFNTLPGASPEGWEISLHFIPAPPEMTVFPVIDIPTPTVPAVAEFPTSPAVISTSTVNTAETTATSTPSMSLTLDRAVQMDESYLLYATLHWGDTPYISVDLTDPAASLQLLDGSQQEIPYEIIYDEQTGVNVDQRQTVFAIKTAPVPSPGMLTLNLGAVSVWLPVDASFTFDPGPHPEPGQEWQPNLEVTIGEHRLLVRSVIADISGYSFEMTSDTGILTAGLMDLEHTIISGFDGEGGSSGQESSFFSSFNYADGLPEGPVTVTISSISVKQAQQLLAQWETP